MIHKNSHPFLILLLICFCVLTNCKSDKNSNTSPEEETTPADINDSKKNIAEVSNELEKDKNNTNSDSLISATEASKPTKDVEEKPAIPTKEFIQPNQDKTAKKPAKKKRSKAISKKKPKILFEELTWDFGEITEGDIVEKKFKFTNVGNAPLEIIATSATCGCTRPTFPFLDIAPGESNVIGVSYNSVGKDGKQDPEVTVESNAYPKIITIKLHGTVKPKPKMEEKSDSTTSMKDSIEMKQ